MSDIIINPLFRTEDIERERKVILDEIKLVTDEPRHHQWILFEKTLFKKHPVRNATYGTVKAVKSINKQDMVDYYTKYYLPNNMVVSVVGDVSNIRQKFEKAFINFTPHQIPRQKRVIEPKQRKAEKRVEKRNVGNSYVVLGYKTPPRKSRDSYVLDIIKSILGRGQSGRMFYEIRTKRGLAYEVGVHHEPSSDYGFFAVYLSTNKKNINSVVTIILDELKKLHNTDLKELNEAKEYVEGNFYLSNEDNYQMADSIGFWALVGNAELINSYIKIIRSITVNDIKRVSKKYLTKNYALAVIQQKK